MVEYKFGSVAMNVKLKAYSGWIGMALHFLFISFLGGLQQLYKQFFLRLEF